MAWEGRVRSVPRGTHEPLGWFLSDARAVRLSGHSDMMWARLLDVPAALSARAYAADGRVVLQGVAPLGYATGGFELETSKGTGACRPSSAAPDLTLPVDA